MATKSNKNAWGWLGAIGLFVVAKLKWVLAIFKIGKFATLASMFVSLGGYAIFFGWKFAFALVYLIFVHEMGHLVAAKLKKIPTSPAIFIPFMGAVIGIDPKKIKDAKTEFFVAYGGPLAGLISILPAIVLYLVTHDPYWGLVIQLGALINLFNLFPVSPLDGGRIVSVLSTNIWLVGLLIMVPIIFISPDPIIVLIFIFGLITWWNRFREHTRVEIMRSEVTLLSEINRELKILKEESIEESTEVNHYGSILFANRFVYLVNQLQIQLKQVNSFLFRNSKFYFPFFQEKGRLEKKKQIAKGKILKTMLEKMDLEESELMENGQQLILKMIGQNDKKINALNKEIDRIKTYYHTSTRTKVQSLLLYLLLAVSLATLLVYGMNILEASHIRI